MLYPRYLYVYEREIYNFGLVYTEYLFNAENEIENPCYRHTVLIKISCNLVDKLLMQVNHKSVESLLLDVSFQHRHRSVSSQNFITFGIGIVVRKRSFTHYVHSTKEVGGVSKCDVAMLMVKQGGQKFRFSCFFM